MSDVHLTEAQITAAPIPMMIAGKECWASPLDDSDIMQLDQWVREEFLKTARASCVGCTQAEREETMRIALEMSVGMTWYSGLGVKLIATLAGMSRLVYQSLRKRNPEITIQQVTAYLSNPQNLQEANERFKELNTNPFMKRNRERANEQQ